MGGLMAPSADRFRQLVRTYIRNFNARDFDALMAIYAEDATLEDPVGTPLVHGKTAIRAFYEQAAAHYSFLQLTGDFRFATDAGALAGPIVLAAMMDAFGPHTAMVIGAGVLIGAALVSRAAISIATPPLRPRLESRPTG